MGVFRGSLHNLRLKYDVSAPASGESGVWSVPVLIQPQLDVFDGLYLLFHLQDQPRSVSLYGVFSTFQHTEVTAFAVYLDQIRALCQQIYGGGLDPAVALLVNLAGQAIGVSVLHSQLIRLVP